MFRFVVLASLFACSLCAVPKPRRPHLDGRIIGGESADIQDYPYQVSLQYNGEHTCGASIISDSWVVTAASCLDGIPANSTSFRVGSSIKECGGSVHEASELIVHPNYGFYFMDCDVAVAKVITLLSFGTGVQPITLTSSEPSTGELAVVTGWGSTTEIGPESSQLQVVTMPIVDHVICDRAYALLGGITANMICAGEQEGGKDTCHGDMGGPLTINGKLAGIISWGAGCGMQGYPGIYSNIATLKGFISEQTGVN